MKVLYFHQYFRIPKGAGGIRSYKFARKLIERGHEVTIVTGGMSKMLSKDLAEPFRMGRRKLMIDGINVIELELPYSNYDSFVRRAITFIRFALRSLMIAMTEKYDVVFATSTPLTASIPGIFASILRRKKFIFEVRDLWPELPREMGVITNPVTLKTMDILEWFSYHCAVKCIGLSPGIVEGIKRRGIPAKDISMIPNGCDLDIYSPRVGERKYPQGFNAGDFIAVFTGSHGFANGLDAVLDAANELKKRNRNDIKFLFVGDGKLKPHLTERAALENLDNCIFWDIVTKNYLAALLQQVDIGLMILANVPAFYYGTSPNKFFDYIAAGLPVLNNYPGWLADMISENQCGVFVEPDNPKLFADNLEFLAEQREQLPIMGKNARMLAERRFNRNQLSDKFVDLLESIAE